jgi:hypothetical protein
MDPYAVNPWGQLVPTGADAGAQYEAHALEFGDVVDGWNPQMDLVVNSGAYIPVTTDPAATSWLDIVPGARQAYDFIVRQVSRFNLSGLEDIPHYQQVLARIGPLVNQSNDATSRRMFDAAANDVMDLGDAWHAITDRLSSFMASLRSVGLGVVPVVVLAAIGGTAVTIASGMYLYFDAAKEREQQLADLVNREVALGHLSPAAAAEILAKGTRGMGDRLTDVLTTAVLVGGAVFALSTFLNRRRS